MQPHRGFDAITLPEEVRVEDIKASAKLLQHRISEWKITPQEFKAIPTSVINFALTLDFFLGALIDKQRTESPGSATDQIILACFARASVESINIAMRSFKGGRSSLFEKIVHLRFNAFALLVKKMEPSTAVDLSRADEAAINKLIQYQDAENIRLFLAALNPVALLIFLGRDLDLRKSTILLPSDMLLPAEREEMGRMLTLLKELLSKPQSVVEQNPQQVLDLLKRLPIKGHDKEWQAFFTQLLAALLPKDNDKGQTAVFQELRTQLSLLRGNTSLALAQGRPTGLTQDDVKMLRDDFQSLPQMSSLTSEQCFMLGEVLWCSAIPRKKVSLASPSEWDDVETLEEQLRATECAVKGLHYLFTSAQNANQQAINFLNMRCVQAADFLADHEAKGLNTSGLAAFLTQTALGEAIESQYKQAMAELSTFQAPTKEAASPLSSNPSPGPSSTTITTPALIQALTEAKTKTIKLKMISNWLAKSTELQAIDPAVLVLMSQLQRILVVGKMLHTIQTLVQALSVDSSLSVAPVQSSSSSDEKDLDDGVRSSSSAVDPRTQTGSSGPGPSTSSQSSGTITITREEFLALTRQVAEQGRQLQALTAEVGQLRTRVQQRTTTVVRRYPHASPSLSNSPNSASLPSLSSATSTARPKPMLPHGHTFAGTSSPAATSSASPSRLSTSSSISSATVTYHMPKQS